MVRIKIVPLKVRLILFMTFSAPVTSVSPTIKELAEEEPAEEEPGEEEHVL
jgi:hypothetical protein